MIVLHLERTLNQGVTKIWVSPSTIASNNIHILVMSSSLGLLPYTTKYSSHVSFAIRGLMLAHFGF
jgi:hypothetical protein